MCFVPYELMTAFDSQVSPLLETSPSSAGITHPHINDPWRRSCDHADAHLLGAPLRVCHSSRGSQLD